MEELFLEAKIRKESGKGKARGMRREGFIPAVVYGMGKKPQSVSVSRSDLLKLIHQHHIEAALKPRDTIVL
jgi:large subunit ribosomal protein L25